MLSTRWLAPLLMMAVVLAVTACEGDQSPGVTIRSGDGPTPTATTGATAEPSATAADGAPSPTAVQAPEAPVPEVDPSLEVLDLGELNLTIDAGAKYGFEPLELAGSEAPPCAAFVFLFGWQVQDPYPPEGADLTITATRMDDTQTIARAESGTATIGCGFVEASNDSAFPIRVQVRYAVAQMTE